MTEGGAPSVQAVQPRVWGVRELVNYLTRQVRFDARLQEIGVRGQITDVSPPSGPGHVYFSLKEPSGALIKCFVRSAYAPSLPALANGTEAVAFGSVGVYEYRSQFQLFATSVQLVGAGALAAAYERMKRKLEAEGLFDPARKRAIPAYPFAVALVSSPDGEGTNDVRSIVQRVPAMRLTLFGTAVQGPTAADAIARALRQAARSNPDVIVLARGGGSDEDRLPFNEEVVARAIAELPVPIVTAIGHRGDHHIADDVADYEAATPTAAAELLIGRFTAAPAALDVARARMRACVVQRLEERRARLRRLCASPVLSNFQRSTDVLAQRVDRLRELVAARQAAIVHGTSDRLRRLERRLAPADPRARLAERVVRTRSIAGIMRSAVATRLQSASRELADHARELEAVLALRLTRSSLRLTVARTALNGKNPEAILQQGYAIVRSAGRIVRDATTLAVGDDVEATVSRGTIRARVEETRYDGE